VSDNSSKSLDFYLQALLLLIAILAMFTLPIQGIVETYLWLRSGEWPNYSLSSFLPVDALLWVYGDAQDWIGLRQLVGKVIQWWASVPVSIAGFVLLIVATQIEG
jgi:hypothetical protein